jgi:hypothetical protein
VIGQENRAQNEKEYHPEEVLQQEGNDELFHNNAVQKYY